MNFNRKELDKILKVYPNAEIKIIANNEITPEYWNEAYECTIDICIIEKWALLGYKYLDKSDCTHELEDNIYNEHPNLSDEQFRALLDLELSRLEFKEYICIYIY